MKTIKIEYDKKADAAYLYLKYPIRDGEAVNTMEINENIMLDFDKKGRLLGVEILNASKNLKNNVLRSTCLKNNTLCSTQTT